MRALRNQRGDTIVEVLLAMAIVGIVLGLSYGTANRSLATGRAAQERGEALKIAESQIELLKSAYSPDSYDEYDNNNEFCLLVDEMDESITRQVYTPDVCSGINGASDFFDVSVQNTTAAGQFDTFVVEVSWERVSGGSNPEDSLTLVYRPVQGAGVNP